MNMPYTIGCRGCLTGLLAPYVTRIFYIHTKGEGCKSIVSSIPFTDGFAENNEHKCEIRHNSVPLFINTVCVPSIMQFCKINMIVNPFHGFLSVLVHIFTFCYQN